MELTPSGKNRWGSRVVESFLVREGCCLSPELWGFRGKGGLEVRMNGEEFISPSVLEREVCGGEGLSSEVMSVCLLGRAIFPKK